MAEIIEKPGVKPIPETTVETTEQVTVPEQVKNEKTFTQTEVDRLVTERLTREKAVSKKTLDEANLRETEYKAQLESYEKILKGFVDEQLKDQSEPVKRLLAKLPILDQLEFLSNPENKIEKRKIPATPKETDNEVKPKGFKGISI